MFTITDKSGFHIEFENGLILSTQFGRGNYCENKYAEKLKDPQYHFDISSEDCEIGVLDAKLGGKLVTREVLGCDDCVMGYIALHQWLELLEKVKNWKRKNQQNCPARGLPIRKLNDI